MPSSSATDTTDGNKNVDVKDYIVDALALGNNGDYESMKNVMTTNNTPISELYWRSACYGYLNLFMYFVEKGLDVHQKTDSMPDDEFFRLACSNNHENIANYIVTVAKQKIIVHPITLSYTPFVQTIINLNKDKFDVMY